MFLIMEAAFIIREIGDCAFLKWMQITAESIKMNKSSASWKMFCGELSFGNFWDVSEPNTVGHEEKIVKTQ